jgi:hypothetical protein
MKYVCGFAAIATLFAAAILGHGFVAERARANEPAQAEPLKVSQFAPAEDLVSQLDYYIARLSEALADAQDYDEAKQSRVHKDANTVAVLGLALAMHDSESKFHDAALIAAAQRLAETQANHEAAAKALADVKQAAAGGGKQAATKWGKVASLAALMQQVPIVNNSLKRGLDPARFKRQKTQSAGQAATLAAIAQAVMYDDEVAKDPASAEAWQALCRQMREAAGEVNAAIHADQPEAAQAGMKRLAENCDACHDKFRDGE